MGGIFAIANGSDGDPLVSCLASRTPLMDVVGTVRNEITPKDDGVGRVAAARLGYRYSLTLESSLCARHLAAGDQHLSIEDLLNTGRALCLAIADLASCEAQRPVADGAVETSSPAEAWEK